jgi:hypothetical protein
MTETADCGADSRQPQPSPQEIVLRMALVSMISRRLRASWIWVVVRGGFLAEILNPLGRLLRSSVRLLLRR